MVYQHATKDRDRLIAERLTAMTAEAGIDTARPDTTGHEATSEGTAKIGQG